VPKTLSIEGLKLLDFLVNSATGEMINLVTTKQPFGNLLSKYFVGRVTDKVRSILEKGRVIGYDNNTPDMLALRIRSPGNDAFKFYVDTAEQ
jgi:hypothetical protein